MPFTPVIPDLRIDTLPMVAAIGDALKANSVLSAAQTYIGQGTAPSEAPKGPNTPRVAINIPSCVPDRTYGDNACRMLADISVTTQGRDTALPGSLAVAVQDTLLNHLPAPSGHQINMVEILNLRESDPAPVADQIVRVRVVNTRIWFEKL